MGFNLSQLCLVGGISLWPDSVVPGFGFGGEMSVQEEDIAPEGDARSLRGAIRKARLSQADRIDVIVDLREAELARLELLFDELQPVFDEMPEQYDQFECALVPGDTPRLWLDMLAYVAMGADKRTYRLVKDRREGRHVLHECADVSDMADHVTEYLAHKVIERERALESIDLPEAAPAVVTTQKSYSGRAVFLSLACGFFLGAAALFIFGVIITAP